MMITVPCYYYQRVTQRLESEFGSACSDNGSGDAVGNDLGDKMGTKASAPDGNRE